MFSLPCFFSFPAFFDLQDVRCGTHYASRQQGQRGDSGWAGVEKNVSIWSRNRGEISLVCDFSSVHFPTSDCNSQHRRLSETSISPPGSSIGSPSRVICVSKQSFSHLNRLSLFRVHLLHQNHKTNTTGAPATLLAKNKQSCSFPWPVHPSHFSIHCPFRLQHCGK